MTKSKETRLANLTAKQEVVALVGMEKKMFIRLAAEKGQELKATGAKKRITTTQKATVCHAS